MNEPSSSFVGPRRARWEALERLLAGRARRRTSDEWRRLAALYRSVMADLSMARSADSSPDVQEYLDDLAARAHHALYAGRGGRFGPVLDDLLGGFPAAVRRAWPFFVVANLLFWGPFVVGLVGASGSGEFAGSVLSAGQLAQVELAYADAPIRTAGEDASMAGFYVMNNVGIAFRCFALGILGGLGTVFYLVYNGLVLGTVEGHLWRVGLGWNVLEFTAAHTPWELMGVVVAGTAGLRMGWALVVTEGLTRVDSLRAAFPDLYRMVLGTTALLVIAAGIEGFWSATPIPFAAKLALGGAGVVVVAIWLAVGGRR